MPSLTFYIPFGRSRRLLLRLVAILVQRPQIDRRPRRLDVDLPEYLRRDVGLLPDVERPPPMPHRFPF